MIFDFSVIVQLKYSWNPKRRKRQYLKTTFNNSDWAIILDAIKHTQIVLIPKPLWQNCAKLYRKQTKVCPFSPPIQSLDVKHKSIPNEKHNLLLSGNRMLPPPSRHITAPLSEPWEHSEPQCSSDMQPPWGAHPEETRDTGLRQLRYESKQWFLWAQTLASSQT